jgi:hypothetical protein
MPLRIEGPGLDSRDRDLLYWLRFFMVFLNIWLLEVSGYASNIFLHFKQRTVMGKAIINHIEQIDSWFI